MQVLYISGLCSITETNIEEKKTESQVNHSQQTTDKLVCRDLATYGMNQTAFLLLATPHSSPIYLSNPTSLLRDFKKRAYL